MLGMTLCCREATMGASRGTGSITDVETALRREIELLTERFPQVPEHELNSAVRTTYERLKRDAVVDSHLVAVTRDVVVNELHHQGVESHLRDAR
jgi:hypothetical protein